MSRSSNKSTSPNPRPKQQKLFSLNWIFWSFLLGMVVLLSVISYQLFFILSFRWFVAFELLILFCFFFLFLLYQHTIVPMRKIGSGMDLLTAQDFNSRLSHVGQPEADRVVKLFNTLMDQLKNERLHVREQNQFLDLLVKASPLGIIILSLNKEIESVNTAAIKLLQVAQEEMLTGKRLNELNLPLMAELSRIERGTSDIVRLGNANIYKCTHASFIDRGFYRSFYLIEQLTKEWFETEKQAYEKVIRTISHEVNNTMAGVSCTLDSLLSVEQEKSYGGEVVDLLQTTIDRCYSLSGFIRNYADVVKLPEPVLAEISLNDMVQRSVPFWESICQSYKKAEVSFEVYLCSDSPILSVDWILFEQALLNIIKNAVEAIPAKGRVVVTTGNNPAEIVVANNGNPIDKESADKLFTPFFSTKPSGQGIGLIVIREVLQRHGFNFSLASYPDGWTRFTVRMDNR